MAKRTYRCRTNKGIVDYTDDELIAEAEKIVWDVLHHKYTGYKQYHEDMAQDLLLAITKAMDRYDPAKGMVFAYIKTIVMRRAYSCALMIRRRSSHEARLTDEMEQVLTHRPRLENYELTDWVDRLKERLTDEELIVVQLTMEGADNAEIYAALHPGSPPQPRVGQALAKLWRSIREKAKDLGKPEDL